MQGQHAPPPTIAMTTDHPSRHGKIRQRLDTFDESKTDLKKETGEEDETQLHVVSHLIFRHLAAAAV